jgi:predicted O-methyltransferase YrrM
MMEENMSYHQPEPNISGWMSMEELNWLYEKASEMETIVEIGSWMGRSTHAILSGCKGKVYAVDHFHGSPSERDGAHSAAKTENIYDAFLKNVGMFPNLTVIQLDAIEAASHFEDKEIDMIFLDADHEYPAVKNFIEAWFPKCKKLFCGHDISQAGTPRAFEELKLKPIRIPGTNLWRIDL